MNNKQVCHYATCDITIHKNSGNALRHYYIFIKVDLINAYGKEISSKKILYYIELLLI